MKRFSLIIAIFIFSYIVSITGTGQTVCASYMNVIDSCKQQEVANLVISFINDGVMQNNYIFDDYNWERHLIVSFDSPQILTVTNDCNTYRSRFRFIDKYRYHFEGLNTIVVDELVSTSRKSNEKKSNKYIPPYVYGKEFKTTYSVFPIITNKKLHLSAYYDRIQILEFLFEISKSSN